MIFSLICFVAIAICVIVNISVSGEVTWAMYPILSIAFVWAVTMPPLLRKAKRTFASFVVASVLLLPYLRLLEMVTPADGWFIPLALPISIVCIIALWLCYFILAKSKINIWFKNAWTVFILGVVVSPTITLLALNFAGAEFNIYTEFIGAFACLVASAVLLVIGCVKRAKGRAVN